MGRMWLVLAVMCTVASDAQAKRIMCACPTSFALPAHGSTDVPINTKVWVLGRTGASYQTSEGVQLVSAASYGSGHTATEEFDLPPLQPNQLVQLKDEGGADLTFHTSHHADDTPPTAPREAHVSITVDRNHDVQAIYLSGGYDSDTALIHIDVIDRMDPFSFWSTPSRLFLCNPGIHLAPGDATLEIRALDLAGNESEPLVQKIVVTVDEQSENPCNDGRARGVRRHRGHGFEILALFVLVPVILVGLGIGLLITAAITQSRIRRAVPEPVSLLVAEAVARAMLKQHLIVAAIGIAGSILLLAYDAYFSSFLVALVPLVALLNSYKARKILWRLDSGDTVAERRNHWLVVSGPRGFAHLRASDYQFRQANRANVPTSIAR